jgi:hypothetical protein
VPVVEQTTLDLSPPPRRKPDDTSFGLGGSAVERWLAELPAAHLGETSKALLQSLHEANRLQARHGPRLRFLEMIRPRVEDTVGALRRHYLPKEFPLPERNAKVAELARALLRELAVGYYIGGACGRGRRRNPIQTSYSVSCSPSAYCRRGSRRGWRSLRPCRLWWGCRRSTGT